MHYTRSIDLMTHVPDPLITKEEIDATILADLRVLPKPQLTRQVAWIPRPTPLVRYDSDPTEQIETNLRTQAYWVPFGYEESEAMAQHVPAPLLTKEDIEATILADISLLPRRQLTRQVAWVPLPTPLVRYDSDSTEQIEATLCMLPISQTDSLWVRK